MTKQKHDEIVNFTNSLSNEDLVHLMNLVAPRLMRKKMIVELYEFTKQESQWLCDLVVEKLRDMGYEPEGFAFSINVELPE